MRTHLDLATRDLAASVDSYRALLDAEPAKRYDDYALFLTGDPGLELALDLDPATETGSDVHFGVVVESAAEVGAAIVRFRTAGDAACCTSAETPARA